MAGQNIKDFVAESLQGYLNEKGLEIWNIEYVKEGRDWFLRLYIDRKAQDGYVSMDDCQAVSEYLSDILDKEDPIEKNYFLEVSSPGMERELFTTKQMQRYIGQDVNLKLYQAIDGKKQFDAKLLGVDDEKLELEIEGKETSVERSKLAKIRLAVKW